MKQHDKPRILITGARLPAALELVRALDAAGASVWVADSLYCTPAGASRRCAGYIRFPPPAFEFQGFRNCMRRTVQRLRIDMIIPVSEEIFYLAQIADELAPASLFAPSFTDLRRLHSKWEVLSMARGCAIRIPETVRATSMAALHAGLMEMPGGVLKPEFSRGAYEARFAPHRGLEALDISPGCPWLIQEALVGKEISTFSIARRGKVLAHATYEPCWRVARGASLYFRPIKVACAERFVSEFVERHGLSGQLSFDLMLDDSGSVALIECNPRTTSGVHLFARPEELGRAFLAGDAQVGPAAPATNAGDKAKAAKLAIALLHGAAALRAGQAGLLYADLRTAQDSSFLLRDPLPLLALYASSLEILLRSRSWQVDARHAYTFDLEWNG
jgi:hypothetical protein